LAKFLNTSATNYFLEELMEDCMRAVAAAWNGFRRARMIPLLLMTVVMGGLFVLFLLGGVKALLSGEGLGSLLFGLFGIVFAVSIALAWWGTQKNLRDMEVDNTWVAVVVGLPVILATYAGHGPGGHYVKEALAQLPSAALKWANPTMSAALDQLDTVQQATRD